MGKRKEYHKLLNTVKVNSCTKYPYIVMLIKVINLYIKQNKSRAGGHSNSLLTSMAKAWTDYAWEL